MMDMANGSTGDDVEPSDERGTRAPDWIVRELLPEDWAGYELGLPLPAVYDLGPASTIEEDMPVPKYAWGVAEPTEEAPEDESSLVVVVFHGGRKYAVHLQRSPELDALMAERIDDELDSLSPLPDPEPDMMFDPNPDDSIGVAAAPLIVGASDSRIPIPIVNNDKGGWYATIGLLTKSGSPTAATSHLCTATLIGLRTVLTAAHCIVVGDDLYRSVSFHPRANRSGGTLTFPWGSFTFIDTDNVVVPNAYFDNACYDTLTTGCAAHDWAVITFNRPSAAADLKFFMRYAAKYASGLPPMKNRGYPACSDAANRPDPCVRGTLYGDKQSCTLRRRFGADNLHNTRVTHTCDTSQGHSGSPIYGYFDNKPIIIGVHVSDCPNPPGDCSEDPGFNFMRNLSPTMVTQINNFRMSRPGGS
jgi:hypothetical protein